MVLCEVRRLDQVKLLQVQVCRLWRMFIFESDKPNRTPQKCRMVHISSALEVTVTHLRPTVSAAPHLQFLLLYLFLPVPGLSSTSNSPFQNFKTRILDAEMTIAASP